MIVIHNRYEERGSLLAVASVTANVSVTTSTAVQLGVGDDANYAGNLVPFGAAAVYLQRPVSGAMVAGWCQSHRLWNNAIAMLGPVL